MLATFKVGSSPRAATLLPSGFEARVSQYYDVVPRRGSESVGDSISRAVRPSGLLRLDANRTLRLPASDVEQSLAESAHMVVKYADAYNKYLPASLNEMHRLIVIPRQSESVNPGSVNELYPSDEIVAAVSHLPIHSFVTDGGSLKSRIDDIKTATGGSAAGAVQAHKLVAEAVAGAVHRAASFARVMPDNEGAGLLQKKLEHITSLYDEALEKLSKSVHEEEGSPINPGWSTADDPRYHIIRAHKNSLVKTLDKEVKLANEGVSLQERESAAVPSPPPPYQPSFVAPESRGWSGWSVFFAAAIPSLLGLLALYVMHERGLQNRNLKNQIATLNTQLAQAQNLANVPSPQPTTVQPATVPPVQPTPAYMR